MDFWRIKKTIGIYDLNLCLLIAGSIFFIPFYFSRLTVDPVLMPRFLSWAILTTLLVAGVLVQSIKNRQRFHFDILSQAVFHLAVWYVLIAGLSLINAVNLAEGVFEWLKIFLSFAFIYVATLIISANKSSVLILTRSVAIMSSVLAMIGILQYFQIAFTHIPGNYLIYATMANKNLNASALFLTLPFAFYGIYRFCGIWLGTCCAAAAGIFYVISLSGTRSVWVAILFSGLIMGLLIHWVLRKRNFSEQLKNDLRKRSLLILAVVIAAVLAATLTQILNKRNNSNSYEGQQGLSAETRAVLDRPILSLATLEERLLLWKRSFQMVQKCPLIGVGTGQWKIILPSYGKIDKFEETQGEITEIQFLRPHNDFLWVLAENGWAGFIPYLGFFLTLIIYALRIVLQSQDLNKTLFSLLMLFGIIGYMIIASFSFPKERIFHSIFLILIAASVVSTYNQVFPKPRKIGCHKIRSLKILIVSFLIFSVFVGIVRFNSEVHTRNALAARQSDSWELVINEIDRADSWFYTLDPTSTPLMWYRGMANFLQGRRETALDDFKKAYEHHPNHTHVLNNLGTCYALLQHPEKAIEFYRKALEISPGFERCLINLRILERPPKA